jgi:hypothetical protein
MMAQEETESQEKKLPSVTQILKPYSNFSGISLDVLQHAAERGKKVHSACGSYAQGLWVPKLDDECMGYFLSFRRWFLNVVERAVDVEFEVRNEKMGYVGHPDLLCVFRGDKKFTIVDLKTPLLLSPTWPLQLAAYKYAKSDSGCHVSRVGTLRLAKDGGQAKFDEFTDTQRAFKAFCGALSVHQYLSEG